MSAPHHEVFSYLLDVGKDILFAGLDKVTNTILCQTGNATDSTPDADVAELWQQPGLWSLPAPPTQGKPSCQALCLKHSNHDIIFATRDLRNSSIYGNLKAGETCIGASVGQARTLYKANGDIWTVTSSGNSQGGQTIAFHIGSDGSFALQGLAAVLTADASGNITLGNGAAAIKISAAGRVDIIGQIVNAQASGVAQISGGVATCLGPKAAPTPATAVAYSVAGPVNLVSTNVFVSPTS